MTNEQLNDPEFLRKKAMYDLSIEYDMMPALLPEYAIEEKMEQLKQANEVA